MSESEEAPNEDRRQFIKGASCAIGGAIGLVPAVAAVRVVLDPIGKERPRGGGFTRLAHVDDLEPGKPTKFTILATKKDKWSIYRDVPVGAVYLILEKLDKAQPKKQPSSIPQEGEDASPPEATKDNTSTNTPEKTPTGKTGDNPPDSPAMKATPHVTAFSTICPHLGCSVDYRDEQNDFFCPCHNSNFHITGKRLNNIPNRGLDELVVDQKKLTEKSEVWVKYEQFKPGISKKIPGRSNAHAHETTHRLAGSSHRHSRPHQGGPLREYSRWFALAIRVGQHADVYARGAVHHRHRALDGLQPKHANGLGKCLLHPV